MNISNNLIKSCCCGNSTDFSYKVIHNIATLTCNYCSVTHQLLKNWNEEKLNNFYSNEYHVNYQKTKGVTSYKDRYEHDCHIADLRLLAYEDFLPRHSKGLDIGSSNSAFVHRARTHDYDCMGLEPGDLGDPQVTIKGALGKTSLPKNNWQWITMHDSIEHMFDINHALATVKNLLVDQGKLIIDLPDFWKPTGVHHWKSVEHLWFLTDKQMIQLLNDQGFEINKIREPIPGKLVFYTTKQV